MIDLAWRVRDLPAELLALPDTAHLVAHGVYNAALLAKREKPIDWTKQRLRTMRIPGV